MLNFFSVDCITGFFYIFLCIFAGSLRTGVELDQVGWQLTCVEHGPTCLELRATRRTPPQPVAAPAAADAAPAAVPAAAAPAAAAAAPATVPAAAAPAAAGRREEFLQELSARMQEHLRAL